MTPLAPAEDYVPGEVLFKTRASVMELAADDLHAVGIASLHRLPMPAGMRATVGGDIYHARLEPQVEVPDAVRRLQASGRAVWAEPNYVVRALDGPPMPIPLPGGAPPPAASTQGPPPLTAPPADGPSPTRLPDDLDGRQWGLHNLETPGADVHAPEAWATTVGRRADEGGPIVAIVDSGIDLTHPDLQANIYTNPAEVPGDGIDNDGNGLVDDVHGHDFATGRPEPVDGAGHGSHVAGIIGAVGDNGQGVVGVAWKTSLLPLRFLDDTGFGDTAAAAEALLYAEKMGARVVNNSWGGMHFSHTLLEVLQNSHALQVCAAGNDGASSDDVPVYPAGYDLGNILAVAATDAHDQLASYSNRGLRTVDMAAPGDQIWSTIPGGYGSKRGTSMAAPHVTGAAALVLSEFPQLTASQLRERLMDSTDPLPSLEGQVASGGRLDVARALSHDEMPPAAIGDLRVDGATADGVTLRWTATGDDGTEGAAARYDLAWWDETGGQGSAPLLDGAPSRRTSNHRVVDPDAPGEHFVFGLPRPSVAGTDERFTIPLLPSATPRTLRVALQVRDKVGNAPAVAEAHVEVPPAPVWFRDEFDGDLAQWDVQGGWSLERDHGVTSVTDSPGGDYPPDADLWLATHDIDLTGAVHPELSFRGRWTVENKFDHLTVEASTDGGRTFEVLQPLEGSTPWATHRVDLTPLAGQRVRLRFHLVSDGDIEMDGLHLDDVLVAEAGARRT